VGQRHLGFPTIPCLHATFDRWSGWLLAQFLVVLG